MHTETLAQALTHHRRGQLDRAAQLYGDVLASQPDHPDALHLLGLLALQGGQSHVAIDFLRRAITRLPNAAAFHANLAEAYRLAGQYDSAIHSCMQALRLRPAYAEVRNTLGLIESERGRLVQAIEHFHEALRLQPDFALAHNNLGNVYRLSHDISQALAHYRRAVVLDGNLALARSNLSLLLLERKELDEALEHAQVAVRLQPHHPAAHNTLGNVLRERGRLAEAREAYLRALQLNPRLAMIHNNLGQALEEEGALDEAIRCYEQAIQLDANAARFHANLGGALREKGEMAQATACYQTALRLDPVSAEAHNGLGWLLHECGQFDESRACYHEALRLKPDLTGAYGNLAQLCQQLNDFPAAEVNLRAALRHDPHDIAALGQLATLLRGKLPQTDLQTMQHLANAGEMSGKKRAVLLFGLAHVYDALGDYEVAGDCLGQANALERAWRKQRGQDWDPAVHIAFVDRLLDCFTPELFARMSGGGLDSERPVFIVGLPRSGTTLLEQILASHSRIHGAGELRLAREDFEALARDGGEEQCFAALQKLERDSLPRLAATHLDKLHRLNAAAERVVDKMPDNYMYLGLLALLFPRARFIHCRRDLRDVAVSCWMTSFSRIRWANEAAHIVARFGEYRRIMAHWAQVLPVPMLEIDYEETVQNLEDVARRLVSWCGLEWEPACLEFYRADRPICTASVTQVRQPIYKHSLARWKHYEATLHPLFRQLESLEDTFRL